LAWSGIAIAFRAVAVSRFGGAGDVRRVQVGVLASALRVSLNGHRTQRFQRVGLSRTWRMCAWGHSGLMRMKKVGLERLSDVCALGDLVWRLERKNSFPSTGDAPRPRYERARLPKKDPFASSITIATPDLDINRERHARGASFRGRRRGEKGVVVRTGRKKEKAGKREAEELLPPTAYHVFGGGHRRRAARSVSDRKNNLSYYSRIAIRNLGRAVKDALRVCEWKTRVEYLAQFVFCLSQTTLS
jgi:hypothetical protein